MAGTNKYAVSIEALDSVRVPIEDQVEEQEVHVDQEYVPAEDLDRAQLLSISGAGRLRLP